MGISMSDKRVAKLKNRFPDRETELLGNLSEEAAEVVQVVCKIQRFTEVGLPIPEEKVEMLHSEIGDFLGVLKLLYDHGVIDMDKLEKAAERKIERLSSPERM